MANPDQLAEAKRRRSPVNAPEPIDAHEVHVLQRLYDSEIDFAISTMWDFGFEWKLGDALNGFVAEGRAPTLGHAAAEIAHAAIKHFPHSHFARGKRSRTGT
jgi:hypothetical protein